jgi:hypothetical protein
MRNGSRSLGEFPLEVVRIDRERCGRGGRYHDCCVRFAMVVTYITQHSLPGGRYPLPGPDFHLLDHASFAWRTNVSV